MWSIEITCDVILTCLFSTDPTLFFNEIKLKLSHSVNIQETQVLQNIKPQIIYN